MQVAQVYAPVCWILMDSINQFVFRLFLGQEPVS